MKSLKLTLEDEMHATTRAHAKAYHKTLSAIIRLAIGEYLANHASDAIPPPPTAASSPPPDPRVLALLGKAMDVSSRCSSTPGGTSLSSSLTAVAVCDKMLTLLRPYAPQFHAAEDNGTLARKTYMRICASLRIHLRNHRVIIARYTTKETS